MQFLKLRSQQILQNNVVLSQPAHQSFPFILLESRESNIIPPFRHNLPVKSQ